MNPLEQYPKIRSALYFVQWAVNGLLAVAGAIFVARQTPLDQLPEWYVLACAIGPVVWAYLGMTAQRNVNTGPITVAGTVVDPLTGGTAEITATVARAEDTPQAVEEPVEEPDTGGVDGRSDTPGWRDDDWRAN